MRLRQMAYSLPEQLDEAKGEDGRTVLVRRGGSPTRPARPTDVSTWWEYDPTAPDVRPVVAPGQGVYETHPQLIRR